MSKKLIGLVAIIAMGIGAATVILMQSSFQAEPASASERGQSGEREMIIAVEEVINGERTAGEVRVSFEDPANLPNRPEDAGGVYVSHGNNDITVGTGSIEVEVGVEIVNDEEPVTVVNANYSGPEETVTFNENTMFYKDTTLRPEITTADIEAGAITVTRSVEAGSADDIAENMMIRIWGHQEDGQLIADVVVYEEIR